MFATITPYSLNYDEYYTFEDAKKIASNAWSSDHDEQIYVVEITDNKFIKAWAKDREWIEVIGEKELIDVRMSLLIANALT